MSLGAYTDVARSQFLRLARSAIMRTCFLVIRLLQVHANSMQIGMPAMEWRVAAPLAAAAGAPSAAATHEASLLAYARCELVPDPAQTHSCRHSRTCFAAKFPPFRSRHRRHATVARGSARQFVCIRRRCARACTYQRRGFAF
eukprot:6211403-Pleurochrysis_carterae.AAC.2